MYYKSMSPNKIFNAYMEAADITRELRDLIQSAEGKRLLRRANSYCWKEACELEGVDHSTRTYPNRKLIYVDELHSNGKAH
jgi:hypothetical protein